MYFNLLLLIMFILPAGLYPQLVALDNFAKENPLFQNRISKVQVFLQQKAHITEPITESKNTNLSYTENFKMKYGGRANAYVYKNGRVLIILDAKNKNVTFDFSYIHENLLNAIVSEQKKGRILTDVVNVANNIGDDNRMLVDIYMEKKGNRDFYLDFNAPFVVLVSIPSTMQLDLEDLFFKTLRIEELENLFSQEGDLYRNAYNVLIDKRDYNAILLNYIKDSNSNNSDLNVVEKIMQRLNIELNTCSFDLSQESLNLLSNPLTVNFIEKVANQNQDLEQFFYYVRYWNKTYSALVLEVLRNEHALSNKVDEDFNTKRMEFLSSFGEIITKYFSGHSRSIAK